MTSPEGTWCRNTGVELRGPELVMHFSDHHANGARRGKLTAEDRARSRRRAMKKAAPREFGPAAVLGYLGVFLCHGTARLRARRARRRLLLPGIMSRLRPLVKVSRTSDPTIPDLIAAMRSKPFGFPPGLRAPDDRLPRLAALVSRVLSEMPEAKSKTAQRQSAVLGVATLLWKMGVAGPGEGDATLLPQPKWFHECSIPDNAYVEFNVAHRAMTRQWLRILKPICTRLHNAGAFATYDLG